VLSVERRRSAGGNEFPRVLRGAEPVLVGRFRQLQAGKWPLLPYHYGRVSSSNNNPQSGTGKPDVFPSLGRFLGCRRARERGHEVLFSSFHCEHPADQLLTTGSVARLRLLSCISFSWSNASSRDILGASFCRL
jgi:hypothetical protein